MHGFIQTQLYRADLAFSFFSLTETNVNVMQMSYCMQRVLNTICIPLGHFGKSVIGIWYVAV